MKHFSGKPDPLDFPEPHNFATFILTRTPQFKTHRHLSQAKNALSGKMTYRGGRSYSAGCDMWVYEWDAEELRWVETFHIPIGAIRETHPLWEKGVKRPKKAQAEVPQKVIDKTIDSILRSASDV